MYECFIAIDVGGTNVRIALIDNDLKIINKVQITASSIKDSDDFLHTLKEQVEKVKKEFDVKKIGIVLPAPYKKGYTNIVDITNIPCIENLEYSKIKDVLSDYKVFFENDVNVIALSESIFGVGKGYKNLIYITFSTGVGSGIIINGKIHNGINGYAGEIGSILIDSNRENIFEGNFENLCSGNALTLKAKKIFGEDKTSEYIFRKYQEQDEKAIIIINEWINYVSSGIANVIHLFDPEIIVLGGPLITCNKWVVDLIYSNTKIKLLGNLSNKIKIETTQFGSDAGLIGAGYYTKMNI
ncbi:MAG: ROK family protein [Lachnospirales bacterium]